MLASLISGLDEERLELDGVFEHLAVGSGQLPGSFQNGKDVTLEQIETFVESTVETSLDDVQVEGSDFGRGVGSCLGWVEVFRQLGQRIGEASFFRILLKFFGFIIYIFVKRTL